MARSDVELREMSFTEPRPLPPRALPSLNLQNGDGTDTSRKRTPRKKPVPKENSSPGAQSNKHAHDTKAKKRSPRNDGPSDVVSLHPSGMASEAGETQARGVSDPSSERRPRKTRRRRQPPLKQSETGELANEHNISALLNEVEVVNVDKIDDAVVMTNLPGVAAGSGGSAPTDKVYVQTTNGFTARDQEWLVKRNETGNEDTRILYGEQKVKPCDVAQQNMRGFLFIALILHGALTGIAIWQVVFCYTLSYSGTQNFLAQYQSLALPTQTVFYIILILCTVSALDRYDFAAKNKHIIQSLAKFDLAAVASVVYYIALLFNIGLAGLDAWIGSGVGRTAPAEDPEPTVSPPASTLEPLSPDLAGTNLDADSTVNTWLIISVLRAVFASLGWIIVAFDPLRSDMTWD